MRLSFYLSLVLALALTFTSCKKEVIYPSDQLPANVPTVDTAPTVSAWGKFLITDAVMYVEDMQTGQKLSYNHFGPNKDTSSMCWGGPLFDIEVVVRNKATYSFWRPDAMGFGKFVLNDDTTKLYCVKYTGQYTSIVEDPNGGQQNMGGSARPFSGQTVDYANKIVRMQIQEANGVDGNGHQIHYWTQLTLKKVQEW